MVFHADKDEIKDIAVRGTELVMKYAEQLPRHDDDRLRVLARRSSPAPSCDFAVEVCEAVSDVWQPDDGREIILNLPATVEMADAERLRRPDRVVLPPPDPARVTSISRCTRTTTAAPPSPPPSWR